MSENPQQLKASIDQEELDRLIRESGDLGAEFAKPEPKQEKIIDESALQKKIDEAGPTESLLNQTEIDKLFLGETEDK